MNIAPSVLPEAIIPVSIELDWPTVEITVKEILEQFEKYDFRTFLLACPCGGWRSVGYPPAEHWVEKARYFARVRELLEPKGIRCAWWITTTLKSGRLEGAVPLTKADGTESPIANCPLDPLFRKRFCEDVARFAKIAKPAFIITEDDYSVNAGTDSMGCFCRHHLAEFNRRQGTDYTREELAAILAAESPENMELERAWRTLKKDSLVQLAKELRHALDEETPEIPMGCMQAGASYREDNCAYEIAKAMAGPNHTPFCRIFGTFYSGSVAREIPSTLVRCLWMRQHTPEDLFFIHESDTYPHTRFFSSAASMNTILAAVYSMGFQSSTFQTQQLLDAPNEEPVYGQLYAGERPRYREVCRIAARCRVTGVRLPFDPFRNNFRKTGSGRPIWCSAVSRMSIPYTTEEAAVAFWDWHQGVYATHEEILRALSGGLILDGAAAQALCRRGYGAYLGAEVGEDAAVGLLRYDLAAREVIREPFLYGGRGRNMPSAHMYAPGGNGTLLTIKVTDPRCEVITELVDFRRTRICPAMTRFRNSLGGRVVVMGETVEKNRSQSLYNYRRQRLLQNLVEWCGGDYSMAMETPDIFIIENRAKSEAEPFYGMLTLLNLCDDTPEPFTLRLPEPWRTGTLRVMNGDGSWRAADCEKTETGILLREPVAHYSPVYLLVCREDA